MSGSPEITLPSSRKGFTLIELLVVVAIIALLTSILMPVLGEAQRQARRTVCTANFHQLGVGLAIYVSQWDGQYFPAASWHPTIFWSTETFITFDNRQNFYDIAGGETGVYYCVLSNPEYWPENSEVSADPDDPLTKWANHFHVQTPSYNYRHTMEETRMLLNLWPESYDFSLTNNPNGDHPREHPGDPRAVTVFDYHVSSEGWRSGEVGGYRVFGWEPGSVLYGDGHVELPEEWKNIVKWDRGISNWFPY